MTSDGNRPQGRAPRAEDLSPGFGLQMINERIAKNKLIPEKKPSKVYGFWRNLWGLFFLMVGTGMVPLFEWWYIVNDDAIGEAQSVAVALPDVTRIDPAFDSKLVHASATAETKDVLRDHYFDVEKVALILTRHPEYFQWIETSKTEKRRDSDGDLVDVVVYSYHRGWSPTPVDSSKFKQRRSSRTNTVLFRIPREESRAKTMALGAYVLPEFMKSDIKGGSPLPVSLSDEMIADFEMLMNLPEAAPSPEAEETVVVNPDGSPFVPEELVRRTAHVADNVVFFGRDPAKPEIGDMRVTFTALESTPVSLLANVSGNTFAHYIASNSMEFHQFSMGEVSQEGLFVNANTENAYFIWFMRGLALLFLTLAFRRFRDSKYGYFRKYKSARDAFRPEPSFANLLIALAWMLLIIAVVWLRYRTTVGIILGFIALVLGCVVSLRGRIQRKKAIPEALGSLHDIADEPQ